MHQETHRHLVSWNFKKVVCLTGPHGVGKTYTVLEFCRQRNKKVVDVSFERERLDVKWESVPQAANTVSLLDAPLLTPGDGGMASLKRFLSTAKQPVVVILDASMLQTFADIVRIYKCIHVTHDSYDEFKKRCLSICAPQQPHEMIAFEQCVRGARRNVAYVLNTYRFLIKGKTTMATDAYNQKVCGSDALYTLLCAPRSMHSEEDVLRACERDGVDVAQCLSGAAKVYETDIDKSMNTHIVLSDAEACYRYKDAALESLCRHARETISKNGPTAPTKESFQALLKGHAYKKSAKRKFEY
jgi:hypothetical protein